MKRIVTGLLIILFISGCGVGKNQVARKVPKAKNKQVTAKNEFIVRTVAFYNLENLFDTINDPKTLDEEFTPEGDNAWTGERYERKLKNLARVIVRIGKKETGLPPVILGVAEVENRKVLEDLTQKTELKQYDYGIVHFDSPDRRGVDVGLIYLKKYFKPVNFRAVPLKIKRDGKRIYTRDVLVVSGFLNGEKIHVLVNHWPSRRGGEARSRPLRMEAAALNLRIADSIRKVEPQAKIIIMGDLNDDPVSPSVKEVLQVKGNKSEVRPEGFYGAMEHFYRAGIGTLAYRDSWNLFDQIILSYPLIEGTTGKQKDYSGFKLWKSGIFNSPFLTNRKGAFKGYPFRTYAGGQYLGGYADHFPVYIILIKRK
jgi:hypothetical protein